MFIHKEIEVELDKDYQPTAFLWNGKRYEIEEVLNFRQDWGFGKAAPKKKNWRLRHHRNYYKVKTKDGEVFEFYLDRKGGRREWVLLKKY